MLALAVSDGVLRGYIVIGTFIGGIVFNMTVGDIMVKWAAAIAAAFKRVSERIKSVFKPLVDRAKAVKMRRVEAKRVKKAAKTVEKRSVKEKSA